MSYYEVDYISLQGEQVKDYFEFSHIEDLSDFLRRQQLNVIKVKKVPKLLGFIERLFAKKIVSGEIIELINHLHIIVKSGLPLHQSLEELALESSKPKLKNILFTMSKRIESGHSLSTSMEPFERIFGFSTIYLVRIGEETGTLAQTLEKAKLFLIQSSTLKRDVRLALIYPLTVLTVALFAVILWFSFVLPQMAEMFDQMQVTLPPLTQFLIFLSDIVSHSYLYVLASLALSLSLLWYSNKNSEKVHRRLTRMLLKLPLLGKLVRNLNVAYITEFLHISLSTGTSVFKAMTLISNNIPNVVYKESLSKVVEHLKNGLSLSASLQKEKLYNPFTIRMLNMGEQSGDLESQLYTVSYYYQQSVKTATIQMTKVIEPFLIILIGAVFALLMVGLMGPIFDIVASI